MGKMGYMAIKSRVILNNYFRCLGRRRLLLDLIVLASKTATCLGTRPVRHRNFNDCEGES